MKYSFIYGFFALAVSFVTFYNIQRPWEKEARREAISDENRLPASIKPADITQDLLRFQDRVKSSDFTLSTCANILQSEFVKLNGYEFSEFDLSSVQNQALSLLNQVFHTRMELRNRYLELTRPLVRMSDGRLEDIEPSERSKFTDCAWAFRRAFRGMRVLEDYLGEASTGFPFDRERTGNEGSGSGKAMPAFQGGASFLQWNRRFQFQGDNYVPQSGDVILSRGTASTSAAIARISDEDTNFSHLTMVWVDPTNPQNPRIETIEAHIEIGSEIFSWNDYVGDGKIRAVIFRYHNPDQSDSENSRVAHEAATKVRQLVRNHKSQNGKRICYDFAMDMETRDCIFCSEIVRIGYEDAGIQNIPFLPSPIRPKNRKFVNAIGVEKEVTFAPADIELDPRFELIGEWRDHQRVHRSHFMDAVLTSMYDWMDEKEYELVPSFGEKFTSLFGYTLRRIPLLDVTVKGKFPLNMKREAIESVQVLNTVVNRLSDYLDEREQQLPGAGPKRLSPWQMKNHLDQFRTLDEQAFNEGLSQSGGVIDPKRLPRHHFHSLFRRKD